MKRIGILLIVMLFSAGIFALNNNNSDAKNQSKAEKEAALMQQYNQLVDLIESRDYVLEADFLSNQYGTRVLVNSTINFIKVDDGKAVIQVGSDWGVGPNGVGGVTAEGQISRYEVKANDKKKSVSVSMNVMTNLGVYDVHMSVSAGGNSFATVSGLRRGKLNYFGDLIALESSRVFEGQTRY